MQSTANSVALPADPEIHVFAGEAAMVKSYSNESTGERDDTEGAKECPGKIPYTELLGA